MFSRLSHFQRCHKCGWHVDINWLYAASIGRLDQDQNLSTKEKMVF